jgi:hypothetical protein
MRTSQRLLAGHVARLEQLLGGDQAGVRQHQASQAHSRQRQKLTALHSLRFPGYGRGQGAGDSGQVLDFRWQAAVAQVTAVMVGCVLSNSS